VKIIKIRTKLKSSREVVRVIITQREPPFVLQWSKRVTLTETFALVKESEGNRPEAREIPATRKRENK
jgi:hypothetical protein